MSSTTYFSAKEMEKLRRKASSQQAHSKKYSKGWSKSKMDPMKVLEAFPSLRIKKGYVLRAYQFVQGSNGNGVVWAMPEDSVFPEPGECPKLEDTFLECPRPQGALEDIMEVIEGDGSDLSYISASLFAREISEFGAMWHGCSWSSHSIIDGQFSSRDFTFDEIDKWSWSEEKPQEWRPSVLKTNDKVIVIFYTYTGLMPAGIVCNTDSFSIDSYCLVSDSKMIVESGGGYIH